jgi:hypothetical protein
MRWVDKLLLRLRSLFSQLKIEGELDEELRFHMEQQVEENVALGMNPEDERYAARRTIGGLAQIKQECRDTRRVQFIGNFVRDIRYGVRTLRKNPPSTTAVTAILALGIGVNTAVFSIVDAVLLRPLPYESLPRLVKIEEASAKGELGGLPVRHYLRWLSRTDLFDKTAATSGMT